MNMNLRSWRVIHELQHLRGKPVAQVQGLKVHVYRVIELELSNHLDFRLRWSRLAVNVSNQFRDSEAFRLGCLKYPHVIAI